jgi:hypothetical protein
LISDNVVAAGKEIGFGTLSFSYQKGIERSGNIDTRAVRAHAHAHMLKLMRAFKGKENVFANLYVYDKYGTFTTL